MRAWIPHLALVVAALAIVVRALVAHVPTEEAERVAFDPEAAPAARVRAAHLAACRAEERSPRLGEGLAAAFLASEDELLREAALLVDLCRHAVLRGSDLDETSPPVQDAYVYGRLARGPWTPHVFRSMILYRRKVGGAAVGGIRRMTMAEADWFLRTLRGAPLPPDPVIDAYFRERGEDAAEVQRALESSQDPQDR